MYVGWAIIDPTAAYIFNQGYVEIETHSLKRIEPMTHNSNCHQIRLDQHVLRQQSSTSHKLDSHLQPSAPWQCAAAPSFSASSRGQ